jgi:hypothetical protein
MDTQEEVLKRIAETAEEIALRLNAFWEALEFSREGFGEDERREVVATLESLSYFFHNLKVGASFEDFPKKGVLWSLELLRDTMRARCLADNGQDDPAST